MVLADLVDLHAAATPDKAAVCQDGVMTYSGLSARAAALARGLAGQGVRAGDRVAVLAHNHPDTLALLLACSRLGAMLAPLNWRLAAPELLWILRDAAPRILAVDAAHAGLLPAELPGIQVVSMDALPSDPGPAPHDAAAGHEQGLLLVYTSGTTGCPKGAVLTGQAMLANAAMSRHMHAMTADDHVLTVLPLFHVGGLNIQTVPALLTGATVTLHPRFDPAATLHTIAAARPTLTVLVPATLHAMYAHLAWPGADLSSLRAVTTGSTTVPPAATAPLTSRGVPVLQVYGATETAPISIYTPLGANLPNTGVPGPLCEARAVDDAGQDVPDGTPGEVLIRGPQVFAGYWNNPAATADALRGGWFHTGDIGTRAPDGTWVVHDRKRNLIVSGGENIYPAEIERALEEHPAVQEAAVTRRPDPRWQEVPVAWVVLRPGAAATGADLAAHLRTQIAGYKVPREVRFLPALPRNAMGKVQHSALPPC